MKVRQIRPTFVFPGKTVKYFGGKRFLISPTLYIRKSHINQYSDTYTNARVCKYVTRGGGFLRWFLLVSILPHLVCFPYFCIGMTLLFLGDARNNLQADGHLAEKEANCIT